MSVQTFKRLIDRRLASMNYFNKVAVEFPKEKRIIHMCEAEIRAIQVEAATIFKEEGQEAFDAFVSEFIIYSGKTKRGSHKMILRTDGRFYNEFKPGFFEVNSNLAIKLY